jgi:hypothetical protein
MCRSIDYGKLELRIRKRHLNFISNHNPIKRLIPDGCVKFFFSMCRHRNTKIEDKLGGGCGTHSEECNYSHNSNLERLRVETTCET